MTVLYCELAGEALLHIEGPDTLKFLQGQTTCDTRQLSPALALPGAYCTPQGRMVCDFLLVRLGDEHVALRLRGDVLETAAATLGKYILFSKAELDAQRKDWAVFGCWGDGAGAAMAEITGNRPQSRYAATSAEGCVVVQLDDAGEHFEAYIDRERHPQLPGAFQDKLQVGLESDWRAWQIHAGVPRVEAATSGEFIPQLFNYDLTGHVSFNKGCYTGQEIIARLHYRGKPKQRTYLAAAEGEIDLPAGTRLFTAGQEQSCGTVANSAPEDGRTVCLVVATAAGVAGGLRLGNEGPELKLLPLPYTLPD